MKYSVIRGSVFLSLSLLLLVAPGCSDDDPATPPDDGPRTMTISVDETSLYFECEIGIVFTSALDGTVLDYATWTGAAELKLEIPSSLGTSFFVTQWYDSSSGPLSLVTTPQVVVDDLTLDWKSENHQDPTEEAYFQFANIPEHNEYHIGSGSKNMMGNQLSEDMTVNLTSQAAEVLVVLEGSGNSMSHMWVDGVMSGSTYPVDLQDMDPMEEFTVGLPASGNSIQYMMYAYKEAEGGLPRRSYWLSDSIIQHPVPATWQVDYLETGFDGYHTTFMQVTEGNPQQDLRFQTKGGLPETVAFWDLTLTVTDNSIDGCQVQPSEPVQEMTLILLDEGQFPRMWQLGVPDYNQPVVVPLLPEELMTLYPDLKREDFALRQVLAVRMSDGFAGDGTTPMETKEWVTQTHSP